MMTEKINNILGVDDIFKAPDRVMNILLDKPLREHVFIQLLELFPGKLDFDFWHVYFQEEAAQRKKMGQDFTPECVALLLAELTKGFNGMYYEVAAGTGGLCIAKWASDRNVYMPWDYKPSNFLYICEELSDRTLPFLVLNMAIRGMNGAAIHVDSLTRDCYGIFFIQNDADNPVGFSSINIMPYSEQAADYFKVKFVEQRYPAHIESPLLFDMPEAVI